MNADFFSCSKSRRSGRTRLMIRAAWWSLAVGSSLFCARISPAQESSSRFLIIADTSYAMRRYAPAAQKAVSNLLLSSMHGQLRRGDTIGMWTFNEALSAGRFPLQRWTPETTELVASNAVAFLKIQRYEKRSRFDAVWPTLRRLISESDRLTVLLISDGDEEISGTPFDVEINTLFKKQFRAQRKARMPFITVLCAQRGQIFGGTMNLTPWPVEFPAFPPEPKIAETPNPGPPLPEKKEAKPTVPPLILIGKKQETPPVAKPVEQPTVPPVPVATSPASEPVKPPTVPLPVAAVQVEPVKFAQTMPAQLTPAPKPMEISHEPVATPAPLVKTTPMPTVAPPTAPLVPPVVASQPVPAAMQPKIEAPPAIPSKLPEPVQTPKAETLQLKAPTTVESKPVEPVATLTPVTKVESSKPSTAELGTAEAQSPAKQEDKSAPAVPATAAVSAASVPIAATPQPETGFSLETALVLGVIVLAVGGGLAFLVSRRQRAASPASLITRSMDKDGK